jgi:hypothetical protein
MHTENAVLIGLNDHFHSQVLSVFLCDFILIWLVLGSILYSLNPHDLLLWNLQHNVCRNSLYIVK